MKDVGCQFYYLVVYHHNPLYRNTIMKYCRFYVQSFLMYIRLFADMPCLNKSLHANDLIDYFYSYHGLLDYQI